jgi:tetratricopeptide (TPR) repeat protein
VKCRACESPNRPGARFCHRCSAPLDPSCIGCGGELTATGELCPRCRTERLPEPVGDELFPDDEAATVIAAPAAAPKYPLRPSYTGRTDAIARLMACYKEAIGDSELRFAVVLGEPGMGKSRALRELGAAIRADRPQTTTTRLLVGSERGGFEGGSASKFGPFARLLADRFGIVATDSIADSREKVIAGVSEVLPAAKVTEVSHLLAHLMGIPFPDSPIVTPLSDNPKQLEGRTFIALRRFFAADAAAGPLVLCFENLELAGPETINLLHYLTAGLARSPVLLACTARPTLFERHPSFGHTDVPLERVELQPLSDDEARALWRAIAAPLELVPPKLEGHALRLGGNPRAIVELGHYLVEAAAIVFRDRRWIVDGEALRKAKLPDSHEQLVAERVRIMDSSERDILEKAAVIGESFWLDAIVSLARVDSQKGTDPDGPTLAAIAEAGDDARTHIAAVLSRLEGREWLAPSPQSTVAGEREFRFSYPHLWSSVYDLISDERRRRYHKLVAQWLELRPDGRSAVSLEDVAAHLELAGDPRGAAVRFRRAADSARRAFFNDQAIRLYARALSCLGEADLAARIHLWHDLGSVYELVGDYEAALGGFERMLRLAWVCASRTKAAVAFNKMGRVWRKKGDLKLALEYLERGRELFAQARDARGIAGSLDDIGNVLSLLGRYDEAFEKVTEALARRGKGKDKRSIAHSLSNLGNIQKNRGRLTEAGNCHREALELRREIGDRVGVIQSLNNHAVLCFERGENDEARASWEQALSEAEDIGALPLQALALCNLGELALATDRIEEARHRLEEGLELAEEVDDRRLQIEATRNLALLENAAGDGSRARELAFHANEIAADAGLRELEGRSLLTLGEVFGGALFDAEKTDEFLNGDEVPTAASFFEKGVKLLRDIGNDAELARGLDRFGRYKIERGVIAEGKAMLEEALAIFSRLQMSERRSVEKLLAAV